MAVAQEPQGPSTTSTRPPPRLHVLDTFLVPPSPSPAAGPGPAAPLPPECSLPFNFFDVMWLRHSPPVERVFLYRLDDPDADVPAILSNLRESLSRALRVFYPLAGRVRLAPGTSDRYELYYRRGDAVTFTVAEYDDDGGDENETNAGLATDAPRELARIAPLVPPLPEGGAVLALQATLLLQSARRCGLLAIGIAVNHAACDGSGSTHFLHTWAAACSRAAGTTPPPPPPPVIDRTIVTDPRGLYDVFYKAMPSTDDMEFMKMSPDQLFATFTLSKDDLQRAKNAVAAEAARRGVAPPPRCSSLVATLGVVWSCYQRAKVSADDGQTAALILPVDHRSRMKPPLPDRYLGNCVGPAFGVAPRDELAAAGTAGLFSACTAVAAGIDEAVSGGVESVDAWMDHFMELAATGLLSVAGSPRFRVYELDLGFGRPAKVDIVSVAKTGAVALAESRSGAGGIEVGVSLPPDGMERFQKCFADAIAGLHEQS